MVHNILKAARAIRQPQISPAQTFSHRLKVGIMVAGCILFWAVLR